jgi:hypothetical protein
MQKPTTASGNTQKELLSSFIDTLEKVELPFYTQQQATYDCRWHYLSVLGIVLPLLTSFIAFMVKEKYAPDWAPFLLVVLPLFTAFFSGLMSTFKIREKEVLREFGRIEITDIILNAKSELLRCAGNEEECRKVFHAVRERAMQLERDQHLKDARLRGTVPQTDAKTAEK